MPNVSTFTLAKQLDADITRIVASARSTGALDSQVQQQLKLLKIDMTGMRLDIRDYESAETKAEQLRFGKTATERLRSVQQGILLASQYAIFSAIEVAQLSAQIAQLQELLQ
jgi:hypothetical protein